MSDIDIYKNGYLIDEDSYVKIPDWDFPKSEEKPEHPKEKTDPTEKAEEASSNIEEPHSEKKADAEAKPAKAKPKSRAKAKAAAAEPEVQKLTREQVEQENHALLEQLKQAVAEQAYTDARNSKHAQLQQCIDEVQQNTAALQAMYADYVAQYTEALKYMAIEIAQKIMLQKIEEDDTALVGLINQTITAVKQAEGITVEISDRLYGLVEYMQRELEQPEFAGRVTLKEGPYAADTVRVSTESGAIDASIRTQIQNLRQAFETAGEV